MISGIRQNSLKPGIMMISAAIFLCIICGCDRLAEPVMDNPLDRDGDNYIEASAVIEEPLVEGDNVIIRWQGNNLQLEYSYELVWDGSSEWVEWCRESNPLAQYEYQLDSAKPTEWSQGNAFTANNIDTGRYLFSVRCRYSGRIEADTESTIGFTVETVEGSAMTVKPRYMMVNMVNKDASLKVQLVAEEISDPVMLAHVVASYDEKILDISEGDVEQGDFFRKPDSETLFFANVSDRGKIVIDFGIAIRNPPGVSGTGVIAELKFKVLRTGITSISFDTVILRGPENNNVSVSELVSGTIQIQ